MVKEFEHITCEEVLRALDLFSLEESNLKGI